MNRYILLLFAVLCVIGCARSFETLDPYQLDKELSAQLEMSDDFRRTMKEIPGNSGMTRWEAKEVIKSLELPLVEYIDSLKIVGPDIIKCVSLIVQSQGVCKYGAVMVLLKYRSRDGLGHRSVDDLVQDTGFV